MDNRSSGLFKLRNQTQKIDRCNGIFAGANNTLMKIYVRAHWWY